MDFADSGKSKVELALDCEQLISQLCDQYSDLLRSGKDITPEQFAENYPDLAEMLRPALAAVRVLVALGKQDLMPTTGSVLGDFRIVRLIARGGMGVVYEANQLSLGRKVAIKVLASLDSETASKAALIRFENEIRASASLDHENIVPIYGVERIGRFHFYAAAFLKANTMLIDESMHGPEWMVIDEVGRLEIGKMGFYPAVKAIIIDASVKNIVLVVRDSLCEPVISFFEIKDHHLIHTMDELK